MDTQLTSAKHQSALACRAALFNEAADLAPRDLQESPELAAAVLLHGYDRVPERGATCLSYLRILDASDEGYAIDAGDANPHLLAARLLRLQECLLLGDDDPRILKTYLQIIGRNAARLTPPRHSELQRFFMQPLEHWESQATELFETVFQELGDVIWTRAPAGFTDTLARLISLLVPDKRDPQRLVEWRRGLDVAHYDPRVRVVMDLIQLARWWGPSWIACVRGCLKAFTEKDSEIVSLKQSWNEIRLLKQPLRPDELTKLSWYRQLPQPELDDYLKQTDQDNYQAIRDDQRKLYLKIFCCLVASEQTAAHPKLQAVISRGSRHAEFVWRNFCDSFDEDFKALTIYCLRRHHERENCLPGAHCDRRLGAIHAVAEMGREQSRLLDDLFLHAQKVEDWTARDLLQMWETVWNDDFADREGRPVGVEGVEEEEAAGQPDDMVRPVPPEDRLPTPPQDPPIANQGAPTQLPPAFTTSQPTEQYPPYPTQSESKHVLSTLQVAKDKSKHQHAGLPNWLFWLMVVTGILVFCLLAYMVFDSLL